jgi:hypothetical protein
MARQKNSPPPGDTSPQFIREDVSNEADTLENEIDVATEMEETVNTGSTVQVPRRMPNPEILKRDPMAEMFGPGSTLRQLGDPDDEMPDEIRGLIEENGLSKREFMCTLKGIPAGTLGETVDNSTQSVYIKAWKRTIPTSEYIAREYGPGNYVLILTWRSMNPDDRTSVAKRETVSITISEKCAAEYKKYQLDKKINEASTTGSKVRDALVEKTIEGQLISAITGKDGSDQPKQTPKEYIEEIMGTVKMLGLNVGGFGAPVKQGIEWDKILPAVIPLATAALGFLQSSAQRRQEEQMKLFMMMMGQNQSASNQVIDMYKTIATKPPVDNPLKELQQMVMSAMDIKEMMNPAKETLSDKIFRVVEMVAPQILTIAAQAQATKQPPHGPAVDMAKMYVNANPDFEKLKNDPAEMKKFVDRLDDRIGWENADVVLTVVEWPRPAYCPRDPNKRFPAQQTAEDAEIDEEQGQDDPARTGGVIPPL